MCRYRITGPGRFIDSDGNDLEPSGYIIFYAYPKDRASGENSFESPSIVRNSWMEISIVSFACHRQSR